MQTLNTWQQQQAQGGFLPIVGLGALSIINSAILCMTGATVAASAVGYIAYNSFNFVKLVSD
jgi:hypothetical protein